MRTAKKRTKTMTVSMIIWSNIVRQQYLQGMTDKDLELSRNVQSENTQNLG